LETDDWLVSRLSAADEKLPASVTLTKLFGQAETFAIMPAFFRKRVQHHRVRLPFSKRY